MFPEKRQAISYAEGRAYFRSGEIRILDSRGDVERIIAFNDTNRKLSLLCGSMPSNSKWISQLHLHRTRQEKPVAATDRQASLIARSDIATPFSNRASLGSHASLVI
jgi:hypothetical protein